MPIDDDRLLVEPRCARLQRLRASCRCSGLCLCLSGWRNGGGARPAEKARPHSRRSQNAKHAGSRKRDRQFS